MLIFFEGASPEISGNDPSRHSQLAALEDEIEVGLDLIVPGLYCIELKRDSLALLVDHRERSFNEKLLILLASVDYLSLGPLHLVAVAIGVVL